MANGNVQEEHKVWKSLVSKYENESQSYKKYKKVFKILGSMVIFAGATVVILALPCVTPFVLAGVKVSISCGVAAHTSGGSVLLIGGILEGMGFQMKKDTLKELDEIIKQTKKIRGTLKVILHFSKKIENKLEDVDNIQNQQLNQWIQQLENATSRKYVSMYAQNISKELTNYEQQCKQIVETVQNAQDGFVNVWKNLAL